LTKWMAVLLVCLGACLAMWNTGAQASTKHHWRHHHQVIGWHHHEVRHIVPSHGRYRHYAGVPLHHRQIAKTPSHGLVTVDTKAGIQITVSPRFAPKVQAFVQALVAHGYHPRTITCFASHGHVRGSLHYRGEACDFDQAGWGRTASTMYHITLLAAQFGLRDGCTFGDCGHVDAGPALEAHHYNRYARNWVGSFLGDEGKRTQGIPNPRSQREPTVK
jgi:hypothetical protein